MGHVDYDSTLIVGSFIAAGAICYIVISMEQLIFKQTYKKIEPFILLLNGLLLAAAISIVHIVGMHAYHLFEAASSNVPLITLAFGISAVLSSVAIWLTSRFTLPIFRLILSSVIMGIGISASYYVSMLGWNIDIYKKDYTSFLILFSVLIAMSGSGLAFLLAYKLKESERHRISLKLAFAVMMTLSIMGMHYTALISTNITDKFVSQYQAEHDLLLFTIILVTCLVLVASFIVAVLEQRLNQRNLELRKANKELANLSIQDNLTKLPNRLYLVDYAEVLLSDHRYKDQKIAFLYIDLDRFKSVMMRLDTTLVINCLYKWPIGYIGNSMKNVNCLELVGMSFYSLLKTLILKRQCNLLKKYYILFKTVTKFPVKKLIFQQV